MLVVKQGFEPIGFTSWFPSWSAEKAAQGKSFEELKQELTGGAGVSTVDEVRTVKMNRVEVRGGGRNPGIDLGERGSLSPDIMAKPL